MHQRDRAFRHFSRKYAAVVVSIVAALVVHAAPGCAASADQPKALPINVMIASPLQDAIRQNTRGESEGYAAGVPPNFAWCGGSYKPPENSLPPAGFTAVTGWAQVYPQAGAPAYPEPDANILVANARTYVRLRATREWLLVQDQATDSIAGAHYVADFATDATRDVTVERLPDGSVALPAPTKGYNTHFWLMRRGVYDDGSVDGVYVQMDMKVDAPNPRLVANVGADWWRNSTADYASGFVNNPGAGMSNWVELSTEWTTLRFYTGSDVQLQASPPPQLAAAVSKTSPAVVRRRANGPPPCMARP